MINSNSNIINDDIDSNDNTIFERIKSIRLRRKNRINNSQKKINSRKHDSKNNTLIDGIASNNLFITNTNNVNEVVDDHNDALLNGEEAIAINSVDTFVSSNDHEVNATFQGDIINSNNDSENKNHEKSLNDPGFEKQSINIVSKVDDGSQSNVSRKKQGRSTIEPNVKVDEVISSEDQEVPFKKKRGFQIGHKINLKHGVNDSTKAPAESSSYIDLT